MNYEHHPLRPKKWRKMEVTPKFYMIEGWYINRETLKITRSDWGTNCRMEYAQTAGIVGIHFTPRGLVCKVMYEDFDHYVISRRQKKKSHDEDIIEHRKQEQLKKNQIEKKPPPSFSARAFADFEHVSANAH